MELKHIHPNLAKLAYHNRAMDLAIVRTLIDAKHSHQRHVKKRVESSVRRLVRCA